MFVPYTGWLAALSTSLPSGFRTGWLVVVQTSTKSPLSSLATEWAAVVDCWTGLELSGTGLISVPGIVKVIV